MGAAPAEHSGVASAVNNVVARAAGLLAVAVLPLLAGLTGAAALESATLASGFRTAMLISGVFCAAGGVLAALTIRNPPAAHRAPSRPRLKEPAWHCGVSGPPPDPVVGGLRGAVRLRPMCGGRVGWAKVGPCRAPHTPTRTLRHRTLRHRPCRVRPGHPRAADPAQPHHQGRHLRGGDAGRHGERRAGRVPPPRGGRRRRPLHRGLPGRLARRPDRSPLPAARRGHGAGPAPADRRRARRGRGRGRPDRPRRAGGQRPLQRRPRPLALRRLHADGLAPARRRRGRH